VNKGRLHQGVINVINHYTTYFVKNQEGKGDFVKVYQLTLNRDYSFTPSLVREGGPQAVDE
jgi:hypothetical protein